VSSRLTAQRVDGVEQRIAGLLETPRDPMTTRMQCVKVHGEHVPPFFRVVEQSSIRRSSAREDCLRFLSSQRQFEEKANLYTTIFSTLQRGSYLKPFFPAICLSYEMLMQQYDLFI
jgi:hypothetical protein